MSTIHHTPIVTGESNSPTTINTRLGSLDSAIEGVDNRIDGLILESGLSDLEVADARNAGNTAGTVALLGDRVDQLSAGAYHPMAYGAAGDGTTNDRNALNTLANTTIGAGSTGYIVIDRPYAINTNVTFPTRTTFVFKRGGRFVIGDGVTVTIRGQVEAGLYQIFSQTGTVKFATYVSPFISIDGAPTTVYPQWWGARAPDYDADTLTSYRTLNTTAANKAIDSLYTGVADETRQGGVVYFTMGPWYFNGTLTVLGESITLQGAGMQNTQLDFGGAPGGTHGVDFVRAWYAQVKDLEIVSAKSAGIRLNNGVHTKLENVRIRNAAAAGVYLGRNILGNFHNVVVKGGVHGWETYDYVTSCTWVGCFCSDCSGNGWVMGSPTVDRGIAYSAWVGCGVDHVGSHGYRIRATGTSYPCAGLTFVSCGAEGAPVGNGGAGWFLEGASGKQIRGVTLIGCFATGNNTSNAWTNFLYAKDGGGGEIIDGVTIIGSRSYGAGAGTTDIVADGAGVRITLDNSVISGSSVAINGATISARGIGIVAAPIVADNRVIASGAISTGGLTNLTIDTQGGAATDDLDTINGGKDGDIIILRTASSSRDVTIKHGTGNIDCGSDRVLNSNRDTWMGLYLAAANRWLQLSFNDNA